jgi:CRISPR-associated exonuclease Cas4
MTLRVTDLRQWSYCPRIVYYQHRMPGVGKATYKMEEGKAAQAILEHLETRRTLREYGWDRAARRFDVWLESEDLGLAGKLDLMLETTDEAAPVEFKLTSGDLGQNHRLQLAGYALLIERELGKSVSQGFVYRIPDGRVFLVPIEEGLRREAEEAMGEIRQILSNGWLPRATDVRKRCDECEYANFCADVW